MSRTAKVELSWADGSYTFRLAIGQLVELQEKCDAGPPTIYNRLVGNAWYLNDIRETLRLGLIGGGMAPAKALSLINRYVDDRPLAENARHAQAVLMALMIGVEDETPGKAEAARDQAMGASPSPPSMA
ncbi:MAG: gene transfer agent family protein [Hyphomonadaceae bacterium]